MPRPSRCRLAFFARHRGEVVSRETLLDAVWEMRHPGATRTGDMHVAELRKKIEPDPRTPRCLLTVHGLGYKLAVQVPAPGPFHRDASMPIGRTRFEVQSRSTPSGKQTAAPIAYASKSTGSGDVPIRSRSISFCTTRSVLGPMELDRRPPR